MKRLKLGCIGAFLLYAFTLTAQRNCGLAEQLTYWQQADPDGWAAFHQPIERTAQTRAQMILPVVVHVVYFDEEQNISDFQIHSQIELLNRVFSRGVQVSEATRAVHGDVFDMPDIRFQLACRAPDGSPTTGITRTPTSVEDIGFKRSSDRRLLVSHDALGGKSPWPNQDYLNIWVCAFDGGLLGRASLPGVIPDPLSDGLTIDYRYFGYAGTADNESGYDLGMTTVHELGHYLGLYHPWHQSENCEGTDFIGDTPLQSEPYYGCPKERMANVSCSSVDMVRNIMGYADDACLEYFTIEQTARMYAVLNNERASLFESAALDDCLPVTQSETDFWHHLEDNSLVFDFRSPTATRRMRIYNMLGQPIVDGTVEQEFIRYQLSQLPAGLYILQIEDDMGSMTRRVVGLGLQ